MARVVFWEACVSFVDSVGGIFFDIVVDLDNEFLLVVKSEGAGVVFLASSSSFFLVLPTGASEGSTTVSNVVGVVSDVVGVVSVVMGAGTVVMGAGTVVMGAGTVVMSAGTEVVGNSSLVVDRFLVVGTRSVVVVEGCNNLPGPCVTFGGVGIVEAFGHLSEGGWDGK